MSAIYGLIDLNKNVVNELCYESMKEPFCKCKIDRFNKICSNNYVIGCGLQYIFYNSHIEELPNKIDNLIYTADIIIDNREELISLLDIDENSTDGYILYKSYKRWNEDFPKYVLGDYSFVIYNITNNEIICGRDSVGSRSLYFSFNNGIFAFSTLIKSLLNIKTDKIELNKLYINDYLAIEGIANIFQCTETVYKGIYKVQPGEIIKINLNGYERRDYFNPIRDIKELKLDNDDEYKKRFIELLDTIVKSKSRTDYNVGMLLSSGLDSNSIAVFAAKNLKDKNLYTYTSIPEANYKNDRSNYYIVDESSSVNKLKEYIPNIKPSFINSEGLDGYSNLDYYIDVFEGPYKSIQNTYWLNEALKKASDDNCRVMLNGQYGNATISYGNIITHLRTLCFKLKFKTMYKEINSYCKRKRYNRKSFSKMYLKTLVPYKIRLHRHNNKNNLMFVNKDLYEEMNTLKRFEKRGLRLPVPKYMTIKEIRNCMYDRVALSQLGEIETKFSLRNGLVIRDPSRDKRMISFCISLPSNQFVKNGVERRLIVEYLRGIVPDFVLDNHLKSGFQSADWGYRLNKRWNEVFDDIVSNLSDSYLDKYINREDINKSLDIIKNGVTNDNEDLVRILLGISILSIFIKSANIYVTK